MNHTPGPWKIERRNTRGEFVTTTHIVAKNRSHIANISPCNIEANAQLIVMAPEMKCVLENIKLDIDVFDAQCSDLEHTDTDVVWQMFNDFRKIIEVTLAQAKGK